MLSAKIRCFALIILSVLSLNSARALDLYWDNQSGSMFPFYTDASFWSTDSALTVPAGAAPVAGDNIFFLFDTSPYNVILSAGNLATNVTASNGDVTLTGPGGSLASSGLVTIDDVFAAGLGDGARVTLNSANWDNVGDALVGDAGFGSFSLNTSGDFRSEDIFIGNQLGSVGVVNVAGVGTTLQTDGLNEVNGYIIGNAGTGTLNVTGGGLARIVNDVTGTIANFELGYLADGEGTLNISDAGSQVIAEDVLIGRSGTGHLNITAGGVLNQNIFTSPDAFVALDAGSSGDVTVNGDGSQWLMARLEIGNLGDATLSVEDGGFVRSNSNDMVLGDAGGSGRVAVFGAGASNSTLQVTNDLYVGSAGLGELYVGQDLLGTDDGNGSLIVGSDLRIGANATNQLENIAYISGPNTNVTVGSVLFAGENGKGTLELRDGATLSAAFPRIGSGAMSNGTLVVTGTGTIFTGTSDFVVATNGTGNATVSDGAVLNNADNFWIGYQSSSVGTLTIDDATVNATTSNTGNLQIGGRTDGSGGTGTLTVQNGGTLNVTDETYIGGNSTASGMLIVTGFGSTYFQKDGLVNDILRIGYGGAGLAEVRDGGRIDAEGIVIGSLAGSAQADFLVTGSNSGTPSTVDIAGFLYVGDARKGTMTVEQGAQVRVATSDPAQRLFVGDDNAADGSKLTVTGAGSRVDYHGTGDVSVGNAGGSLADPAILEVSSGGVFSAVQRNPDQSITSQARIIVGDLSGGNGRINVSGADSLVEASAIYVGDGDTSSTGALTIFGGTVKTTGELQAGSNGNGVGVVSVHGSTSVLEVGTTLSLGDDLPGDGSASGSLSVGGGGTVTNGSHAYIGHFTGSIGFANIGNSSPATSSWTIGGELTLAGTETSSPTSGSGELNVNSGGLVDIASNLRIRNLGDVNLNGGELRVGGNLLFTDAGSTLNFNTGMLRLTDSSGATLDSALLGRIFNGGPQALSAGMHLAVDGTAALGGPLRVNGGTLSVGAISKANFANVDFDAGTLNFTNSGLVVTDAGLFGSTLVVDENETINVATSLFVQADGLLNVARGSISASGGVNSGTMVLAEGTASFGSSLTNDNTLVIVDSTINGDLVNNGTLELVGDNTFGGSVALSSTSTLGIDIGGTQPGEFDVLQADEFLTLDGTLNVSLDGGFAPQLGDSFGILRGEAGFAGSFDILNLPALSPGLAWQLNPGAITVFLDVVSSTATPGDFDGDGDVDGRDFLVWQRGGSPDPLSAGDLADWQAGYEAGSLVSSASVPEPGTLILLLGGIVVSRPIRRRSRHRRPGMPPARDAAWLD